MVVCQRVLPYSAEKVATILYVSPVVPIQITMVVKKRKTVKLIFPYWVDSSCSIKHGGRQVDKVIVRRTSAGVVIVSKIL